MSTEAPAYKQRMLQARDLRGTSGGIAFDRAALLVRIFEDQEFRSDPAYTDEDAAVNALDDLADGLFVGFLRLRQMVKAFPHRDEWVANKLTKLEAKVVADANDARRRELPEPQKRKTVTVAQFDETVDKLKEVKSEKLVLEIQHDGWTFEKSRLLQRIQDLEGKLADAQATIGDLQGQLTKDLVTA